MNNKLTQNWGLSITRIRFLLIVLLVLGVFFRLVNLDRKVYWHDEAYTSLRIAGYTAEKVNQNLFNGQVIGIEDLQKYQRPNPEKGLVDTINTLVIDDAQHPPLYYIVVRLWVQWFGNSVAVTRSLSALISLLVFPLVYYLCLELFESSLVGWVAIALIAVSPFHVLYAQEAREYSLWTVTILLSSWLLLRASRLTSQGRENIWQDWGLYAIAFVLSLYTFSLSVLIGIGHGLYIIAIERFQLTKTVIAYFVSSLIAGLLFSPWLAIALTTWSKTGATWTAFPIPLLSLLKTWGLHINRAFILTLGDFGFDRLSTYLTLPLFLILVVSAIYLLCRYTSKRVWLFVLTLMGTTFLSLALPDLILGGQRSTSTRYLVSLILGIQLSLAYLIATQIAVMGFSKRIIWRVVMAIVISVGVVSCAISSQSDTAWNKVVSYNNPEIARIVNQSNTPLLISSSFGINFGNSLALSYLLDPKVRLQIVTGNTQPDFMNIPKIPQGFSDVFFLNPSDPFRERIEKEYNWTLKLIYNDSHLWLWKRAEP
ncbi:MAG: hypothetical protein Fur006_19810 [Coleofasciculaceae cyanobacterium]